MKWIPIALCLALAPIAGAESPVSLEEWQYLQRVGVINSVNEDLWSAFEDSGGWNTELAGYARDATRLNVRSLHRWGPPVPPLQAFHNSLVGVLTEMERFYSAVAQRNFGSAEEIGGRIRREMLGVQESWSRIQHRYATPASP